MLDETSVIELCRDSVIVMLKLSGPFMVVTMVLGLVISLVQAITHIQEQTLTFVPKMIVVFGMTILLLPFMLSILTTFTNELMGRISGVP